MNVAAEVRQILTSTLQLGSRGATLTESSGLLGVLPEFDSMAVVSVITELEERFGIVVDDDEIDASTFQTVGTLIAFVQSKVDG